MGGTTHQNRLLFPDWLTKGLQATQIIFPLLTKNVKKKNRKSCLNFGLQLQRPLPGAAISTDYHVGPFFPFLAFPCPWWMLVLCNWKIRQCFWNTSCSISLEPITETSWQWMMTKNCSNSHLSFTHWMWLATVSAGKNPPFTRGSHVLLQVVSCQCDMAIFVCTRNNF